LHIGCDEYHVPLGVHPHIDFISPTVSTIQIKSRAAKQKRGSTKASPASFPPYVRPANLTLDPAAFAESGSTIPCCKLVESEHSYSGFFRATAIDPFCFEAASRKRVRVEQLLTGLFSDTAVTPDCLRSRLHIPFYTSI
jgi:hypothetical protein